MFSTQYTLAQSFANIGSGRNDRSIYADIASKFHSLSEQVGYLSVKARNAFGDGANATNRHDDTSAILDAITEASLSGRGIEFPAGVYYITKNITIYDCKFYKGAILLPAQDVFISMMGYCDAGFYQIFDSSLGGFATFWDNPLQDSTKISWWGVKGDTIVDDWNAWDLGIYCSDDYGTIAVPARCSSLLTDTLVITDRAALHIRSNGFSSTDFAVAGTPFPGFFWNGYTGGTLLALWTCVRVHLEGLGFFTDDFNLVRPTANVAIDCDGDSGQWTYTNCISTTAGSDIVTVTPDASDPTKKYRTYFYRKQRDRNISISGESTKTIKRWISKTQIQLTTTCTNTSVNNTCTIQKRFTLGTACIFDKLNFQNQNPNANLEHLRMSQDSKNNQEYHIIRECVGYGGSYYDPRLNGFNATVGSNIIQCAYSTVGFFWPGKRFRMYGIGNNITLPDGTAERGGVDCFVGVMIDTTHFTIVTGGGAPVNAQASVSGITGYIGQGTGKGTKIGPSFNVKTIKFYRNSFTLYETAHYMDNGSCQHTSENLPSNEFNYKFLASTEPIYCDGDNSENSRVHALISCSGPTTFRNARLDNSQTQVNAGYIQFANPGDCIVQMFDCSIEVNPGSGSTVFDAYSIGGNPRLDIRGGGFGLTSLGKMGLDPTSVFNGRFTFSPGLPLDHIAGPSTVAQEIRWASPIHSINGRIPGVYGFKAETRTVFSGTPPEAYCYEADLNQEFIATGSWFVGLAVKYAPNGNPGDGIGGDKFTGVKFFKHNNTTSTNSKPIRHLWSESPNITGSGHLPLIEFLYSDILKTTHVDKAYLIHALGINDIVNYLGPSYLGAPTTSPDLTELANSQLSWNVDEVGNKLIFTVRYSGGTVKTGSVNLI